MSKFFMPTKVIFEKDGVLKNKDLFKLGKRAFIVTSPSSLMNGSLEDVTTVLKELSIEYSIYSKIAQNPSVEQIDEVSKLAREFSPDFIIGIGGGSPLDSSKAVAVLCAEKNLKAQDLFDSKFEKCLPIVAIPTTCGTGSEVTPYSILTLKTIENKKSFASELIFPKLAIVDYKYLLTLPFNVIVNTLFDALSHVIEGYLSKASDNIIEAYTKKALSLFASSKDNIKENALKETDLEKFAWISLIGGIIIAQTGTLIVHPLGYNLTYYHDIPHGRANAILLSSFLRLESKYLKEEVNFALNNMGFESIDEFSEFVRFFVKDSIPKLPSDRIEYYAKRALESKNVANLRHAISLDEMIDVLKSSVE
ncbi:iron-containing alcohol dehydrogenase [Caldicellulosiruptor hydrothermalis 108]|uniref:Iron-containing alcohol dehydrogenase n=1 Tax=Caldicellulosiruptor hydrothermalis (strain DSM 18901 / VKM B-2411 / 108) TaxID=632292 RepID=E4QCZ9_CALH1|nr:iron-containing alcohol dehydrogenase family protein [Caldicellulosiruptor hydrothermalis]ADQ07493.1 iron-containing alcohol dehydrogenase [Caldicellulosiruptor hydrothermalis 108]